MAVHDCTKYINAAQQRRKLEQNKSKYFPSACARSHLFSASKYVFSLCEHVVYPTTLTGALILVACILFCILLSITIYCTTHSTRAPQTLIVSAVKRFNRFSLSWPFFSQFSGSGDSLIFLSISSSS